MEPFDLPTLDGLHLVPGLCDGVLTGAETLAGFHGINAHGSERQNIDGYAFEEPVQGHQD